MKKTLVLFTICALFMGGMAFGIDEEAIRGDDGQIVTTNPNAQKLFKSAGPGSLTTTFIGGNGFAGNMFDIVPTFDMWITAMDINITAVGETAIVDIFWKDGTCVGYETDATAWTYLGTFTGTGAGSGNPTWIDMYGNGKTFMAGQTYGICMHLQNYATITGNVNYTNGAPTVYSNPDLSLTTWCSQHDPVFTGFNPDRMWNGTIYYDDPGVIGPRVLMWVNGSTDPVSIFDFQTIDLEVQVDAFSGAGVAHDVWIIFLTPLGVFSYTGGSWIFGLVPYASGPLADLPKTNVLPAQLLFPSAMWLPIVAVDDNPDGMPDSKDIVDMAYVPIVVSPFTQTPMAEDFNDGVADNWVDDGAHWSVPVDTYYLDCPSYARFVSYYNGSAYADFTYTADLFQVDTGNASMTYDFGMFFRSDGTLSNGYDFYAEPDGSVYLYKRVGGVGTSLYSNTLSTFWNVGFNVWNTVSIDARGSTIDIYINGNLEASVTDSEFTWGYVGLNGQGSGSYDQNFEFDNITVIN